MDVENITKAEWEVMRVVWTKKATTSSEVSALLEESFAWKPSTVKTLLNRLVDKNFLSTKKDGKRFIYEAVINETQGTESLAEDLTGKICARKIPDFLLTIMENSQFTLEDLENIEKLVAEKKQTAVATIPCNCLPGHCDC